MGGQSRRLIPPKEEVEVSWGLRQLCRDLLVRSMCPCNFTFHHGATYDYCRVTLVFDIGEGEIEGTDVEKLTAVFGGQEGGPMEGLAPLIGEMLGVERAPIEVVHDGLRHSVRIGDAIESGLSTSEFSWAA